MEREPKKKTEPRKLGNYILKAPSAFIAEYWSMRYPDWEIIVEEKDKMYDSAISDEMSEEEPSINVLEENAL